MKKAELGGRHDGKCKEEKRKNEEILLEVSRERKKREKAETKK